MALSGTRYSVHFIVGEREIRQTIAYVRNVRRRYDRYRLPVAVKAYHELRRKLGLGKLHHQSEQGFDGELFLTACSVLIREL